MIPQEFVASMHSQMSSEQQQQQHNAQPMSPEQQHQQHLLADGMSVPFQETEQQCSTPEQQLAAGGSAVEGCGDDPNSMVFDESIADGTMMSMEQQFSPGGAVVESYSPEYHESNQQQQQVMECYSPGVYSYHSQHQQQDVTSVGPVAGGGTENYTPGSYQTADETMGGMMMVDGCYGSSHHGEYQVVANNSGHQQQQAAEQQYYYSPYNYIQPALSPNAQRVLRLASELEMQPWAVQVKAIPTATVPVVKMLADPSRLPGLVAVGDSNWMGIPPPPISPEQLSSADRKSVV